MLPIYLDQVPDGSSTRPLVQYAQLHLLKDEFRKYDFGSDEKNIARYGTPIPPEYDLNNVQVPVALFVGDKDDLADPMDAQILADHLPNLALFEIVDYVGFTHMDFVTAVDADKLIYKTILEMMKANDE
jgi:pimeloyl-ACP methyl ester carboxylesterase